MSKPKQKVFLLRPSDFVQNFLYLNNAPFSLADYPWMSTIYDVDPEELVMCTSRQVSKCEKNSSLKRLANGQLKLVQDLRPGDELLSFDEYAQKIIINKIKAVSDNGKQLIYRITTRTGREANVTGEHPFWTLNPKWTEAKDLQEGDLIGLSCNNAVALPIKKTVPDHEYIILAHLLAEGGMTGRSITYTNNEYDNVYELGTALKCIDTLIETFPIGEAYPGQYRITNHSQNNKVTEWLRILNLMGCSSQTKFHPELIYQLTKEQLCDYLRIWWNTDGYVSVTNGRALPHVGIGLISKELIDGLQELLLRLGITTTKYEQHPKIYDGTTKSVHVLHVEGADSIEKFYALIKTRKLKSYQKKNENNNRLVIPKKALQPHFDKLKKKYKGNLKNTRHRHGWTQWQLKYDLTYSKLKELKENLNDRYLKEIYDADIRYDRITSIEVLPHEDTTSIEMEAPYNTYLIDNLVTHNSSTIANILVERGIIMPATSPNYAGGFKSLFVSPTVDQTKVFSHERLAGVIEESPFVKNNYINSTVIQNVFSKFFTNGSKINLRYSLLTADRIRGLSVDMIAFDETQDLLEDNIGIIEMCMARSHYKHRIFAGTPKRTAGALALRWKRSTKNEWMVKCDHCSKYNYLDQANIGLTGIICRYCGLSLNPKNGRWVRTNPTSTKDTDTGKYITEGFRVNVLMFANAPWVKYQTDILLPMTEKPTAVFLNEYLGIEYDSGVVPITEDEIKACCTGGRMKKEPDADTNSYPTFMGLDYGPVNSTNSYTLHTIIQNRGNGIVELVSAKRYMGREADFSLIHDLVPQEYYKWNCQLIGADNGYGEAANAEIRKRINDPHRLIAFQHLGNQKQRTNWNQKMEAYTLGRNKVMTEFFQKIKNKKIIFPDWADFQHYAKDILAIALEYNEETQKYKYVNNEADDAFHSIIYGCLVAELHDKATNPNYIGS